MLGVVANGLVCAHRVDLFYRFGDVGFCMRDFGWSRKGVLGTWKVHFGRAGFSGGKNKKKQKKQTTKSETENSRFS